MDFKQIYTKDDFVKFLKGFLPDDFEVDQEELTSDHSFKFVEKVAKLGECKSLDLKIYEIDHKSENDPRVTLSKEAFRLMRSYASRRSLIIFKNPKTRNYRLSLITFQTSWDEGRKIKTEYSNPRRFSFYLGPDARTKTPEKFLKNKVSDFIDLVSRFDVEVVTKEFFAQYKKLYLNLLEQLDSDHAFRAFAHKHSIQLDIFTKKILGQIVFIYFLQRKGWMGARKDEHISKGNKNFLRTLFEKSEAGGQSYFNEYLEPIFYNCLNKKPEMAASFYRERFDCQIPFLNGGLFEPLNNYDWEKEFIHIPNELFSNQSKNGILDIFDLYNFTIDENTPDDQEVSVDPEMLGKVFENLIEENIRKGQGAFYTPREIVHYMCKESLLNYLIASSKISEKSIRNYFDLITQNNESAKAVAMFEGEAVEIDNLLRDIKVCDPACGSGAFLIGMLNEIIKLRILMRIFHPKKFEKRSIYQLKKETIQNSLYGVDIDPGAIDIAKLRFWLAIVVDEDIDEIEPLPNLDYKLMQGNSLLEDLVVGDSTISFNFNGNHKFDRRTKDVKNLFEAETQAKLFLDKSETLTEKLEKLHTEYFNIHDIDKKKILKRKIDSVEDELIMSKCQEEIKNTESQTKNSLDQKKILKGTQKLLAIKEVLNKWEKDHFRPFFPWKLHFGEVFNRENSGFDIIIANPPYIKEYTQKSAFDGLRESPYYKGKMDIWYFFACKSIDLVKDRTGVISFIAQNNWVTSYGASRMRGKVINDAEIITLIDFGNYKIFEAGIQTMIMIFKKDSIIDNYSFDYRVLLGNNLSAKDVIAIINKTEDAQAEYLAPMINRVKYRGRMLTFSGQEKQLILDKLTLKANFHLDPVKEIAQGIVCPQDYVNKSSQEKLGPGSKLGDGIFILSDNELNSLELTEDELSVIRPYYTTKELTRWHGDPRNRKWIIYTNSSFKSESTIAGYAKIRKHLDRFKKVITSDNKPYGLHRARDEYFFKGEKIIAVRKCARPTFTYTNFDSYVSATFYVIKTERIDQKYLVGLLNSKLVAFWLRNKGKMQGINFQIDKEPILALPLVQAKQKVQNEIIDVVDKILSITNSDDYNSNQAKQSEVYEHEHQIDQKIYKIYDLTPEEIKAIEGAI